MKLPGLRWLIYTLAALVRLLSCTWNLPLGIEKGIVFEEVGVVKVIAD